MGPAGVGWRGKNGQTTKIVASDVSSAVWMRIGLPFQLKLEAKNGTSYKFDGFREADYPVIQKYVVDSYKVPLKESAVSHKGWNWGVAEVDGSTLKFQVDGAPSFELPIGEATAASVVKTDVSIVFNPAEQAVDEGDILAEIKFFVPNTRGETEPAKDENGEEEEIPEYNEELLHTPAEALANKILDHIEVLPANAQPIVVFERTSMVTPRSQIDLQLHPSFFFLAGKNFRIDYSHVVRIFLLPQSQANLASFVLSLDPPIRQGSTSYPLIVFQIPTKDVKVELNRDGIPENSKALTLGTEIEGPLDQVVARIFGTLADKKVTVPGVNGFKSAKSDEPCVACKYKNGDGSLYPLENSFICVVPKNPIHIPFSDIASVDFELHSQFITLNVQVKTGALHSFVLIPAAQHSALWNFCKAKGLKLSGNQPADEQAATATTSGTRSRSQRTSALNSRAATRQEIQRVAEEDEEDDEDGEFHAGDDEDDDDEVSDADEEIEEEEEAPKKKKRGRPVPTAADDDAEGEKPSAAKKSKSEE
jgi:structure-specific recognition protein 1